MSRDVTRANHGGGMVAVPRISPELRKLLNRREVVSRYGSTESDDRADGGGDFSRGRWIQPDWVDMRERDEARAALPAFEQMAAPVPEQAMLDFLNFIWLSTRHPADLTWKGVCASYPRVLRQFPAYCWRPERLDLTPHAFPTWFPTAGELAAFMQPDRTWIEEELEALRGVAEANVNSNAVPRSGGEMRPWAHGGSVDHAEYLREKADRERAADMAIILQEEADAGLPPRKVLRERPGETRGEFADRSRRYRAYLDGRQKAVQAWKRGLAVKAEQAEEPEQQPTESQTVDPAGPIQEAAE